MPEEWSMVFRILVASGLGAVLGFQREKAHKQAGLRTHILISLGASLFTVVSLSGFGGGLVDQSRVAAGIVTGIGFLGAGAIMRSRGGMVAGLTTAASIWTTAAIGLAAGVGMYWVAAAATVVALVVLLLPHQHVQ